MGQVRHENVCHQSSKTTIASFDRGAEPGNRHQSEERRELVQARDGQGSQN